MVERRKSSRKLGLVILIGNGCVIIILIITGNLLFTV